MGVGNDYITESLKKNNEEIQSKRANGEKLSFGNYFLLVCQIGLLLCSIGFAIFILKFIFEVIL